MSSSSPPSAMAWRASAALIAEWYIHAMRKTDGRAGLHAAAAQQFRAALQVKRHGAHAGSTVSERHPAAGFQIVARQVSDSTASDQSSFATSLYV